MHSNKSPKVEMAMGALRIGRYREIGNQLDDWAMHLQSSLDSHTLRPGDRRFLWAMDSGGISTIGSHFVPKSSLENESQR
jgi:hypothetical protein